MTKTPRWLLIALLLVIVFWCLAYLGPSEMIENAIQESALVAFAVAFSWLLPPITSSFAEELLCQPSKC